MADFVNFNDSLLVVNGENDAVIPLPDAIAILRGQFLAAGWPWIFGQSLNDAHDAYNIA